MDEGAMRSKKTGGKKAAATSGQPRRSVRPNQNVVTFVNVGALNEGILAHMPDNDGHYTDRANEVTGDKSNSIHVENEITASQGSFTVFGSNYVAARVIKGAEVTGTRSNTTTKASQNDDLVIDSLNNTMTDGGIEWTEVTSLDVVAIFGISITSCKNIDILITRIEAGECDDVLDGLSKDERKAVMDAIMTVCEKYLAASNGGANDGTDVLLIHVSNPYDVLDEESEEEFENVFDEPESITMGILLIDGSGISKETVCVEYEWKPPRCEKKSGKTRYNGNSTNRSGVKIGGQSVKSNVNYVPKVVVSVPKMGVSNVGRIDAIDADEEITLVSVQNEDVSNDTDKEMFDVDVLDNSVAGGIVSTASAAITVSAATTTTAIITTIDDITLAQALEEIKSIKPKEKGIDIQELDKSTPIKSSQQSKYKGKGIFIEPVKRKDQIRFDEETALKLQAAFDEEERIEREKAEKVEESNIALIETWDDIQAKIDAGHQLAERI
nr:hypothetical protein [Tanacetum cinerariifolium]